MALLGFFLFLGFILSFILNQSSAMTEIESWRLCALGIILLSTSCLLFLLGGSQSQRDLDEWLLRWLTPQEEDDDIAFKRRVSVIGFCFWGAGMLAWIITRDQNITFTAAGGAGILTFIFLPFPKRDWWTPYPSQKRPGEFCWPLLNH